ncbi:hypothetical protein AAFC00_000898 [Neodothiora populina]|uniref:endo-polygalacturonase n=1 Tax=Neodothiora populina TaxID=2781224 RepID=A0ABR3PMH5_9PEZI
MVRTALPLAVLASAGASLVAAAPTNQLTERASCTFTTADAAKSGKASCSTITLNNIKVPAGETLDLTKLKAGTKVIFEGTTSFAYKEWEGPLISVSGSNIEVSGASGHVINAGGASWWDGKGTNGGKKKPKFFYAHSMKGGSIKGLNVKDTPVQGFSINSSNDLTVSGITIDNKDGDKESGGKALGHNTDAFDVGSSTGIHISDVTIYNQDDCLAINSGTDISFTGSYCSGGHGISIGSVGGRSDNTVENVFISNNKIVDSDNGARIKTVYGATGAVKNVTYSDITLSNIAKYGIVIEQDYENGSPTGKPTTGVPITDLHISGITGTVASKAEEVYILCGKGSCSDWSWSNVKITGGKKSSACAGIPSGASC